MVHQHLRLVESMTVAENVVLGCFGTSDSVRFSPRAVEKTVAEAADRFQMSVDPRARIWQLSLGRAPACRDTEGPLPRRQAS